MISENEYGCKSGNNYQAVYFKQSTILIENDILHSGSGKEWVDESSNMTELICSGSSGAGVIYRDDNIGPRSTNSQADK